LRTTQDFEVARGYASAPELEGGPSGVGWVAFAAMMLGITGIWNVFEGIAAISSAHVYTADASYVFSDLNTWGWIILVVGAVQGTAALALLSGSELARWFGIAAASVNAIAQLMFLPAYPLWALAIFAVDILIIYGLAVYAGKRLRV
jgi:hypothetical protein